MGITTAEVQSQRFRLTFRGFDPVQVDGFLARVADELERLGHEAEALRRELEEERRGHRALEEAMSSARSVQEAIVERARSEADALVAQARTRAERILAEAEGQATALRRELGELGERRSLLLADLSGLVEALRGWLAGKTEGRATPGAEAGEGSAGDEDAA